MSKIDYRYDACGLDNVILKDLTAMVDDDGDEIIVIPKINLLHKKLLKAVSEKPTGIDGKEMRFARTEMGQTQAELAKALGRDGQTIGRWERGECPIEPSAETLLRIMIIQYLNEGEIPNVKELANKSILSGANTQYIIDASDPENYKLVA